MLRSAGIGVTVFGCGWILMGLEIVGGRMLAPYFGSGIWVWGSVISVFLAALSVGYFLGGLLSQWYPHGAALALVILLAALSLLPVTYGYGAVSQWFAEQDLHERWGSLFAATSLFFAPSALLGMVSPYAVRLVTPNVAASGTTAGALYAISTIGGCLGCLLTAFYFILLMGIRQILFVSAAALVVIAVWTVAIGALDVQRGGCLEESSE